MSELPRRFYKTAAVIGEAAPYGVALDTRPIKTPGKEPLALPSRRLSEAVAAEWQSQGDRIDPFSMPLTRLANTAIDRVASDRARIEAELVNFVKHDLVCYRAEAPEELSQRQAAAWNPVIDWAMEALDARFAVAHGIRHIDQPETAVAAFGNYARGLSHWGLTALHNMATLADSVLIAAMCAESAINADDAWAKAHIDEAWQIERWGEDQEARQRLSLRRKEFEACCAFVKLSAY